MMFIDGGNNILDALLFEYLVIYLPDVLLKSINCFGCPT